MNPSQTDLSTHRKNTFEKEGSVFNKENGVLLAELAVLGAAGYVLWRNRDKIQSALEKNGIQVPAIFSANLPAIIEKGASWFSNMQNQGGDDSRMNAGESGSRNRDRGDGRSDNPRTPNTANRNNANEKSASGKFDA